MPFEFADIVLVPFPFTTPEGVKEAAGGCGQQQCVQHRSA